MTVLRPRFVRLALVAALLGLVGPASAAPTFVEFESGLVRPLALSQDGKYLYAVNTPNNRLEVFQVNNQGGIGLLKSVAVGMEPVSVAVRSATELWVVNHLSDSVSIVDVTQPFAPKVTRTLLVGDEPRDIVFAGNPSQRAFITTAHRGQQRTNASIAGVPGAGDPQLITAGVNRADVWVFDPASLGSTFGGTPLRIVTLFGDTPRALAVSADGNTVYAAVHFSGNQTTTVSEGMVCNGFGAAPCNGDGINSPNGLAGGQVPGGNPGPSTNVQGITAPEVGLIVKYHEASGQWRDENGRNWSNAVRFFLPDRDVFAINANTLVESANYTHVGTTIFNMVTNPTNGNVYVSNTESQNLTRFEGPGVVGGTTVQGNLAQSRITVITPGGAVKPRHLNRHIDYAVLPAPPFVKDASLATPVQMVLSPDGAKLFVAAFGSSKIGVIDTADLDNDALWDNAGAEFDPLAASADYIDVSGGGPAGLVLNSAKNRLYVLTRFNSSVVTIDTTTGTELASQPLAHNPEPASVVDGRFMLYDAVRTSSNGEAACASCHVFGDLDQLGWDLGNPDDVVTSNPIPINLLVAAGDQNGGAANNQFHPMKGPMTTQTLRGLSTSGAMHWRGDRADGFFGLDSPYGTGNEALSFNNFIVAFEGLVGLDEGPTDPQLQVDMQKFTDFALQLTLPPNPIRNIDNSLTTAQAQGLDFYDGPRCSDGACFAPGTLGFTCEGCHRLDPAQGFFGTGTIASFENETQIVKIAHLRNLYQKIGMFGMPDVEFNNAGDNNHKGNQIRGFGYLHDGSTDTVFRFLQATVFNNAGAPFNAGFNGGDPQRRQVEQFTLAFPTDLAPAVGQQVTDTGAPIADIATRIGVLRARAAAPFTSAVLGGVVTDCDLVVKGIYAGEPRGFLYVPGASNYQSDRVSEGAFSQAQLDANADGGNVLTYTCAPPGSGVRMGIDEDLDGFRDRDELDASTSPSNAGSAPGACNDGIDNDGDGVTDLADAGCKSTVWNIENPECNDGVNNDPDGLVDMADPQCGTAFARYEAQASCGIGFELAFVLPPLMALRRLRRRRA
jgi:DNA-binding beta-propeller fold protein YncE